MSNAVFSFLDVRKELLKKNSEMFGNIHAVPTIEKIVISTCCSKFLNDGKKMEQIRQQLINITGRIPVETKARISVASFKIREGMHLGYMVTLRGKEAEQFLFRLIYLTMPRIPDFKGVSPKSFDGSGNYNLGIPDVSVFMEIKHELETKFGLNITIATSAKNDKDGCTLLKALMVPFREKH